MNYKKNEVVEVTINRLGMNAEGIGTLEDGTTIFVPFTYIGENVLAKIIKVEKRFVIGKLETILKKSPFRVQPLCPVFQKCGGCQLQHLSYEKTLEFKTNLVKETLKKVGQIEFEVNNCIKSENEYHYRNKISLPVREVRGEVKLGFFATNSHRIVEIEGCPLQQTLTNDIITLFKQFMDEYEISAYNEETKKGLVKHLVAREFNEHLLVAVVINGTALPSVDQLYEMLQAKFKKVTLYLNHNTLNNNVILGSNNTSIGGEPYLEETLQNITVKTGVISFMQINNDIRNKMYEEALQRINAFSPSLIVDAYSGAGLLTGIFAKNTKANVIGLEIVEEAVEASNKMLKENGLENRVTNILGDCAITLPEVIKKAQTKTTLVVDPPRKGLDKSIIKKVLESRPNQIIYIACGLTALSRDLAYLLNKIDIETGLKIENPNSVYEIKSITPYDMFPQTKHVETLVELRLK